MKKLITLLLFLIVAIRANAQTTITKVVQPNLDTIITTTTINTTVSSVTHVYKPPVSGIINGKLITTSITNSQVYFNNQSNILIKGKTIDLKNGSAIAVLIQNCKAVHITKCIIQNTSEDGIQLTNCSNVLIDSCLIVNVKAGVNAIRCTTVQVLNNQFLNMNGPFPSGNFVQFNNVNGSGNWIKFNRCEDIAGVAKKPEDGLSVYQCNGLQGDSVQVIGNWIRGGQITNTSGGGAGIVLGDVGGSYQVARNNTVVNGGFVGMQVQGGTHIKMDHNIIYSIKTAYSNCGLCYGNYSGKPSSDINMSYNKVRFYDMRGGETDAWIDPKAGYNPIGWNTNILKAPIDATVLPTIIITYK